MADGTVLIVDDSPTDVRLLRHAFEGCSPGIEVEAATTGDEALRFLEREGPHEDRPEIHLMVLDLNMPGTSGFEVLEKVRASDALRTLPVVVYSSSTAHRDVSAAYATLANSYVVKPVDLAELRELAQNLTAFWFRTSMLPRGV